MFNAWLQTSSRSKATEEYQKKKLTAFYGKEDKRPPCDYLIEAGMELYISINDDWQPHIASSPIEVRDWSVDVEGDDILIFDWEGKTASAYEPWLKRILRVR